MDPFGNYSGIDLFGGNPVNAVNPYNSNPLMIAPAGQQQPGAGPRIPPFSPEEEQSILSRIGGGALKGLGWLGGSLSKAFGGRAIRGLLGGHLDELASVIPFSDTMGITDPTREIRGSDLLGGDQDTSLLSPTGAGGLALDVLLDPATYLTFGGSALTEAGQAAKRAGSLADTTTARMLAGQQGLVGLGMPFAHPSTVLGAGQGGVDTLNAIGSAASKVPGVTPLYNNVLAPTGRALGALFDPTVRQATTTEGRIAGRQTTNAIEQAAVQSREVQRQAAQALAEGGSNTPQGANELRAFIEQGQRFTGPARPGVQEAADILQPDFARQLAEGQTLGLPGAWPLQDEFVNYFPRHMGPLEKETAGFGGKSQLLPTSDARLSAREDILRNFPQGTQGVNDLTGNQGLYDLLQTAPNQLGPAATIRESYLGSKVGDDALRAGLAQKATAGQATAAELEQFKALQGTYDQSLRLADYVKGLDPEIVKRGGLFNQNPLEDFLQSATAHNRVAAGTEATYGMLAKNAVQAGAGAGRTVPMTEVLAKAGLGESGQATAGAKMQMIQRLGLQNPADLLKMEVPESIAADAAKMVKAYTTPEGLEPFLKLWDSATNLTKAGQTSLWPAFHARNAVTGLWQNFVTNSFDPRYGVLNPMRYLQPFKDAWALRNGGAVLEDAAKIPIFKGLGLTDAEATQKIAELAHDHGVLGRTNLFSEVIGGEPGEKLMRLPGEAAPSLGSKLAGSTYNPLDIAGVGGIGGVGKSNATRFLPAVAGQHIGETVDETNRLSAFVAKLRQGFEPSVASAESKLAHFDYSALTPFERSTMRRVIPFYNWMSNNIPFSVKQLAEQPGGKLGVALKASGEAQGRQGGLLPESVQSGLALPLGRDEEAGTQRFLTHTGLPFEDLASYASGTNFLGNLNPMIKAPLELATGRQLMSGRRLSDLYQSPTGSPVLNELIANSPVGRVASTFRTGVDERKTIADRALNMLTGAHMTDVNTEQARSIAVRDFLEQALSSNPHFRESTDLNVRPEALAELSPQEIALLRLKATRDQEARQRARIGVRAQ
jgi:hypothetical protein